MGNTPSITNAAAIELLACHRHDKDTLKRFETDGVERQVEHHEIRVALHGDGRGKQWLDYMKMLLVLAP